MSQHLIRPQGNRNLTTHSARNAEINCNGTTYLDLGGASQGAAIVGHNHPHIVTAIQQQATQLIHIPAVLDHPTRHTFLTTLHQHLPPTHARTYLANSGTEAIEAAIKLAITATGRNQFTALKGGFHGRTLGALGLMDRPHYRGPFENRLAHTTHIPPNDPDALSQSITPQTAALVLEPIQGEGGVHPLTPEYLAAARDLCHDQGALLIADEIQTGLGRTGTMLATTHTTITPDIITLGKGLAGGLPIGATITTPEIANTLPPGSHGTTYGGSPLICAAGTATLQIIQDQHLFARSQQLGNQTRTTIQNWNHPLIREVRGRGLMIGIDLRTRAAPIVQALQQQGILALTAGTTTLRLLPPLTIPEDQLNHALATIHHTLSRPTA